MATIYSMANDGNWKAPGLPDVVPGGTTPPPPPPPPGGLLRFGTTLFGQSSARYKLHTISGEANRYDAVENDTFATVNGVVRRGSAVVRLYGGSNGPGTWSSAKPSYVRTGQPICYSWKWPANVSETTAKNDVRAFLDSKPTNSNFAWLCVWHEPDDNIRNGQLTMTQWMNMNVWTREVLDEAPYAGRTGATGDLRFGMITTGVPWNKGTQPDATHGWRTYYNRSVSDYGAGLWDYMGGDRYNPGWDGNTRYLTMANWMLRKQQMYDEVGKPFVVGEGGTARATTFPSGWTTLQRDNERAQWVRDLYDTILASGFFDAFMWWRVPANSNNLNAFSTIMITPTGYNADISPQAAQNGNFDAQPVVNVHSEYCINSMIAATPSIPFYVP